MTTITATFHTPERTLAQKLAALQIANDVRVKRARLKRELASGQVTANVQLAWPPYYAKTMKVYDLLMAVPQLGTVRVNKMLRDCGVSGSKTIGGITSRQRQALIEKLTER